MSSIQCKRSAKGPLLRLPAPPMPVGIRNPAGQFVPHLRTLAQNVQCRLTEVTGDDRQG